MTAEEIARLRALLAAATPGPWLSRFHPADVSLIAFKPEDLALSRAAVNALPGLLDELAALAEVEAALGTAQVKLAAAWEENAELRVENAELREGLPALREGIRSDAAEIAEARAEIARLRGIIGEPGLLDENALLRIKLREAAHHVETLAHDSSLWEGALAFAAECRALADGKTP